MRYLRRTAAFALVLAMLLTAFAGAGIKAELPVVDAQAFTEKQQAAAALLMPLGIVAGTDTDTLGAGSVTRAQMVAFIYRLVNGGNKGVENYAASASRYTDVAQDAWYAPYINWAYAAGVAYGVGNNLFAPDQDVTGAQAAAMLVRLLGKDASGEAYALKAQSAAIALELDKGIETKGLYENTLSRGDMFILLANAMMTEYRDGAELTTIARKYFDLEIIEGAILLGMDAIGSNEYNVFSFRTSTEGDVKRFRADLLCIENLGETTAADFDCIGCKYTLLVSGEQDVQGYRQLYAAYEEPESRFYKILTGTVDDGVLGVNGDGTLIYRANGRAVSLDEHVRFYYNETETDLAGFLDSFSFRGVYNKAVYKLIDNDGDGAFEYAVVQRLGLEDMKADTLTAKLTAVNADGTMTLTKYDGSEVTARFGSYWHLDRAGNPDYVVDNADSIRFALGISQPDYAPYTAISTIYYDFVVVGDYLMGIGVSAQTDFRSGYGILDAWAYPMTMYKDMPYGCFVNENSEYFWAYVDRINETKSTYNWGLVPNDSLIYFTEIGQDVLSFQTAGYWNSNYTYRELLLGQHKEKNGVETNVTIDFPLNVWSQVAPKGRNYTDLVGTYSKIYAIFDFDPADPAGDGSAPALQYWDAKLQSKADVKSGKAFDDALDRRIDGYGVLDYRQLEGKYYAPVDADSFYGVADLDECLGFIYVCGDGMTVGISADKGDRSADELQIYCANGYWHLRFYTAVDAVAVEDLAVTFMGRRIEKEGGVWYVYFDDNTDPMSATGEEKLPIAEFVKGFDSVRFEEKLAEAKNALASESEYVRSDYTLLDDSLGVIFAYGSVLNILTAENVYRWVAFDANTFDSDFGLGNPGNDLITIGNTADELIYTVINGKTYIKALKVSDKEAEHLPFGWLIPKGYDLVVFGSRREDVSAAGWSVRVMFLAGASVKDTILTLNIYMPGVERGDVVLIRLNENKEIVEAYKVNTDYVEYLRYAVSLQDKINIL